MSSLTESAVSVETEEISETDSKTAKITIRHGKEMNIPEMSEDVLPLDGNEGPMPV